MKILSAVIFDRGQGIFDGFIKEMFKRKATAKEIGDNVTELLYKLMQNSLYGKSGQNEIIHSFKLIKNEDFEQFERKNNTDLTQVFGNKTLVRTQGKISGDLEGIITKLFKDEAVENKNNGSDDLNNCREDKELLKDLPLPSRKMGGVKSSVSTAAAITAYARIAMSKYKNIEGNKYFGGDTDSVIMEKELDDNLIGKGLGMMKEEGLIKIGLFADKKLYLTVDEIGQMTIKSRGVGRSIETGLDILNFDDFIKLFRGETLEIHKTKFLIERDGIYVKPQAITVKISPPSLLKIIEEVSAILVDSRNPLYELALKIGSACRYLILYKPVSTALKIITYGFVLVIEDLILFKPKHINLILYI